MIHSAATTLAILALGVLGATVQADELDEPPPTDKDPRCLARKAATEAYLKSIVDAPVAKGKPCPPDPETVRQRYAVCSVDYRTRWQTFIADGFSSGSSMLSKGVPFVVEKLGEPQRIERDEGCWDIDIYEIPRTLYFPGVTIVTHDYIDAGFDIDLKTAPVETGTGIYQMLVDRGDFQFAFGLTLDSSRADVEEALGLPCSAVARSGRPAARKLAAYSYGISNPAGGRNYSVTISFDRADNVDSVSWSLSAWH